MELEEDHRFTRRCAWLDSTWWALDTYPMGRGGRRERELRCTGSKEGGEGVTGLVDHQSMGLHGRGRVVQGIRVLRRLPLQLALVAQRTRTTITEKPAQPQHLSIDFPV